MWFFSFTGIEKILSDYIVNPWTLWKTTSWENVRNSGERDSEAFIVIHLNFFSVGFTNIYRFGQKFRQLKFSCSTNYKIPLRLRIKF